MSPRVFACDANSTPPELAAGGRLLLSREESHYLRRVRRVRQGAQVEVLDGAGGLWSATVRAGDARATELDITARLSVPKPACHVDLLLGMPESSATLAALTVGPIADRFGRKRILQLLAALYAVSAVFSALAPSFWGLVIARFIGGYAFGTLLLAPIYIAEISPARLRNRLAMLTSTSPLRPVLPVSA